jgi:hypothetical protein
MTKIPTNLAAVYGIVAGDLQKKLGDAQAAQAGPPVTQEITPVTDADRVDAWNARDPKATDEAMMQMALQKYQEHLAAFGDPEKARQATAEDLTHFRYGKRVTLYTYGAVGYAEQVQQAEQLSRLAKRKTTPDPPPPPPSMPTAALTNAETTGMPVDESMPAAAEAPAMPTAMPMPMAPPAMPMPMPPPMTPPAPAPAAAPGPDQGVGNVY